MVYSSKQFFQKTNKGIRYFFADSTQVERRSFVFRKKVQFQKSD